jgi:hypothetical protein
MIEVLPTSSLPEAEIPPLKLARREIAAFIVELERQRPEVVPQLPDLLLAMLAHSYTASHGEECTSAMLRREALRAHWQAVPLYGVWQEVQRALCISQAPEAVCGAYFGRACTEF